MTAKPTAANAAEIKNSSDVCHVLENEIATGVLGPGTRLEEVALGERFGLSRTPIREALRSLSASGFVEIRPNRGAVVSAPKLENLLEMFETMAEMEAICARLAARRMTNAELDALVRQHEKCSEAAESSDSDVYYKENAAFHEVIYEGSHNAYLCSQVKALRRRLQIYRRLQLKVPGRIEGSYEEHSKIVAAILAREPQTASEAIHDHITVQGDMFNDWMATLRSANVLASKA